MHDMRLNGDEAAWENGNFSTFLPDGRYRNKRYQLARPSLAYLAIGIHGQWLFVDPETQIIIVKLSSQALPQDDLLDVQGVAFLTQFSKMAGQWSSCNHPFQPHNPYRILMIQFAADAIGLEKLCGKLAILVKMHGG